MKKICFQKSIAQLYVDISDIKSKIKEQFYIENFSKNTDYFLENLPHSEKKFFSNEIKEFQKNISNKTQKLLIDYKKQDIDKILEDYAYKYFELTAEYVSLNPNFYDAIINITPVWKEDFNRLLIYIENLKINHPRTKITNKERYTDIGNSTTFGKFEIATDMHTAFLISNEINGNYTAQIQVIFLAINPAFLPVFSENGFNHANNIGGNRVNNYLDIYIIASITKGALSINDTPINIMKIFLNDVFANKLHYHYIDNLNGNQVTLTDVSRSFLLKK